MSGIVGGNLGRGSGLIKAGAIDDDSVTLAKMAGLARGKLIYGDTSGDPAALAVGAADEVLTHDGTDFDWAAAGGGGLLTKINSTTLSGAAVAQSSCFNATYRNYFVTFDNLHVDTDTCDIRFKFYSSAGPTDDSKSSGGLSGYGDGFTPSVSWSASNNAVLASNVESQAGDGCSGFMYVFNPISTAQSSSKMVWNIAWTQGTANNSGGANGWNCMDSTASHTGFYWHISSGNYDGGVVTSYGITDPT